MNKPPISIITIVFNGEEFISKTIESVISQNYSNLSYIIIDGGSTDSTLEKIEHFRPHLSKFISEPDKGISDAFNKGLKLITDPNSWVLFLNCGDILAPNILNTVVEKTKESPNGFFSGYVKFIDKDDNILNRRHPYDTSENNDSLRKWNWVAHQATFIQRNIFDRSGFFNVNYKYLMDYDLWLRMSKFIAMSTTDLCVAYFREDGKTDSIENISKKISEFYNVKIEHSILSYRRAFFYKNISIVFEHIRQKGKILLPKNTVSFIRKIKRNLNIKW